MAKSEAVVNARADYSWIKSGKRILIAGASGTIGRALMKLLAGSEVKIGAQYHENPESIMHVADDYRLDESRLKTFAADLSVQDTCHALVDSFVEWAGGIDSLVQLTGNVRRPCEWEELTEEEWLADINVNLSGPFFLAQRAMRHMREGGGRIVLSSTASAKHGGGKTSLAYGVAKAGIECLIKGLARDGARYGVLVNGIAPGFIESAFHTKRMRRDSKELAMRIEKVPLKRAGRPEDVARLIVYLLSCGADFITGECIAISGGDWL